MHGLLILVAGSGCYRDAAGTSCALVAGQVWALFPGLRHNYGPGVGETWCESFIDASGGILDLFEQQGLLEREHPVWRPAPADAAPLRRLIDDIVLARLLDPFDAQLRLHAAVLALARSRSPGLDPAVLAAQRILEETPPERPLDLRRVADQVGLSWESLRKRFRRQLGHGPLEHRLTVRCRRAAELLLMPGADVSVIAEATGFCDPSHLGRHFRSVHGMTPAVFRRMHGG